MKKQAMTLYINEDLRLQLKKEALAKGLSLNAYITMMLMERSK